MYVSGDICMYVGTYVRIWGCMYVCGDVCMCVGVYCTYVCEGVCMCLRCMYKYICVWGVCTYVCGGKCMCGGVCMCRGCMYLCGDVCMYLGCLYGCGVYVNLCVGLYVCVWGCMFVEKYVCGGAYKGAVIFTFFHISESVSPSLFSLGPKSSENVKKNKFIFSRFVQIFLDFFENLYFFRNFQN